MENRKFIELFGDPQLLANLINEFSTEIPGIVDIVAIENNMSVHGIKLSAHDKNTEFCAKVHGTKVGHDFCLKSEKDCIDHAFSGRNVSRKKCFAGLDTVVIPIFIRDEPLAAIVWSQFQKEESEALTFKQISEIENLVGLKDGSLFELTTKSPKITEHESQKTINYLTAISHLIEYHCEQTLMLSETKIQLSRHIYESSVIHEAISGLMKVEDIDAYWLHLDETIGKLSRAINATCALAFLSEDAHNEVFKIKSLAQLPREDFFDKIYLGSDPILRDVVQGGNPKSLIFNSGVPNSACEKISSYFPDITLSSVALLPISLSEKKYMVIAFFISNNLDTTNSLPIHQELPILFQISGQIATAYLNCQKHSDSQKMAIEQDMWFQTVSHQLIGPLFGLQLDADRLLKRFDKWERQRIINQIKAIKGIAKWVARLVRNFDWQMRVKNISSQVYNLQWLKLRKFLIECAIDLQGLAAPRGIRVHVNKTIEDTWYIHINKDNFSQAIQNLLDNSIKYAKHGTSIEITAIVTKTEINIIITNFGIPLKEVDIPFIYDRGYRSSEAKAREVIGTGIGLPTAKEIIEMHGGRIATYPSSYDSDVGADKVTFTISLPSSKWRNLERKKGRS